MSERVLRIVVADDHPLVRRGLTQVLELDPLIRTVGEAGDPDQLLALVGTELPDVVVTDIRMPPTHQTEGIEAAHRIRAEHPSVGVVVLSAFVDAAYAHDLFRQGTQRLAYLLKDRVATPEELVRAIVAVAAGGSVVDPVVVDAMVRGRRAAGSRLGALSERESEVLALMATGRSNPAIGAELFLSRSAVEKHITSIFGKLGLVEEASTHRRVAAVVAYLAEREGTAAVDHES